MPSLVSNKKIRLNFEILETFEAGIELLGHEAKAVQKSLATLDGAHVTVRGGEAFLIGATISPYQPNNIAKDYDPTRLRRLLLSKKQLKELADKESVKGLTIVPISLYSKGRKIKVEIAIVRGKKQFDKRQTMKERAVKRDINRTLKTQ